MRIDNREQATRTGGTKEAIYKNCVKSSAKRSNEPEFRCRHLHSMNARRFNLNMIDGKMKGAGVWGEHQPLGTENALKHNCMTKCLRANSRMEQVP